MIHTVHRIGSWKPSAAGSGGPQGAITAETAEPGASCTSKLTLIGTLPPAERARQAKSSRFFRILGEGDATQGKPAPRPRLEKKGIREEEVIKDRFVGPLARLLSGQGVGRIGRRAEMRRCGGETQVIEASSRAQPSGAAGGRCLWKWYRTPFRA